MIWYGMTSVFILVDYRPIRPVLVFSSVLTIHLFSYWTISLFGGAGIDDGLGLWPVKLLFVIYKFIAILWFNIVTRVGLLLTIMAHLPIYIVIVWFCIIIITFIVTVPDIYYWRFWYCYLFYYCCTVDYSLPVLWWYWMTFIHLFVYYIVVPVICWLTIRWFFIYSDCVGDGIVSRTVVIW